MGEYSDCRMGAYSGKVTFAHTYRFLEVFHEKKGSNLFE